MARVGQGGLDIRDFGPGPPVTAPEHPRDNDPEYLERTAQRLRTMTAAEVGLSDADPGEVRKRLERMAYGGSRQRNQHTTERQQ